MKERNEDNSAITYFLYFRDLLTFFKMTFFRCSEQGLIFGGQSDETDDILIIYVEKEKKKTCCNEILCVSFSSTAVILFQIQNNQPLEQKRSEIVSAYRRRVAARSVEVFSRRSQTVWVGSGFYFFTKTLLVKTVVTKYLTI